MPLRTNSRFTVLIALSCPSQIGTAVNTRIGSRDLGFLRFPKAEIIHEGRERHEDEKEGKTVYLLFIRVLRVLVDHYPFVAAGSILYPRRPWRKQSILPVRSRWSPAA